MVVTTPPPPLLRLAWAPLAVLGSRFQAGEAVTVRLAVGRHVKLVRTRSDSHGAFRAPLPPLLALDPCHGKIVVTAVTAGGDSARLVRECRTADPVGQ